MNPFFLHSSVQISGWSFAQFTETVCFVREELIENADVLLAFMHAYGVDRTPVMTILQAGLLAPKYSEQLPPVNSEVSGKLSTLFGGTRVIFAPNEKYRPIAAFTEHSTIVETRSVVGAAPSVCHLTFDDIKRMLSP